MSYEVLARKLRPAGFDALVGQEHVVRALRHALDNDRLHHAYLFTGTRGVGKTTIARIVAKSLNCEQGVSASPCGECSVCVEVRENRFIDLIEVDAASRTGVDDTRDLLENAQYMPTRGRYKVYLIDEVHMLSTASFNALLKTLEEPPAHVKFLLATTDPKKVPVTVLSRCLQFQLKNLSRQDIADYIAEVLSAESVEFEAGALQVIARCAAGSMRDALSLTDQAIAFGQGRLLQADIVDMLGVVGEGEVDSLLSGLAAGSAQQLMRSSADLAERNADFSDVLQGLLEAFHQQAVAVALGDSQGSFSAEELQLYYQIALLGHRDLANAPDQRSGFEMTLLRMLAFAPQAGSKVPVREELQQSTVDVADSDGTNQRGSSAARRADTSTEPQIKQVGEPPGAALAGVQAPVQGEIQGEVQGENQGEVQGENQGEIQAEVPSEVQPEADAAQPSLRSQTAQSQAAPSKTARSQSAPSQTTPDQVSASHATSGRRPETTSAVDATSPLPRNDISEQWADITAKLSVGGVTRMIAEHANLVKLDLPEIEIILDAGHDTLLNDSQQQHLSRALGQVMGEDVKLQIHTGPVSLETPAMRRQRLAQERQAEAEQQIRQDTNVNSLLAEFNGRVEEIRPL